MTRRGWLGVALLLAALLTGWLAWIQRGRTLKAQPVQTRSDYVLHEFELVSLDEQGRESFTLRAPFLRETPGARSMDLTKPHFTIPDKQGRRWTAHGNTGFINDKRDRIDLRGAVVVASPADAEQPVKLETEALDVFPEANRATSAAQVTVTRPGLIMRGVGLDANLDQNVVILKSQVKGQYVPSRR